MQVAPRGQGLPTDQPAGLVGCLASQRRDLRKPRRLSPLRWGRCTENEDLRDNHNSRRLHEHPLGTTRGPSRKVVVVGVGVLMALTLVRGLFWVVGFPVWSGDEGAHFDYEQSVATFHGIPVSGVSLNSAETLRLIKESPVATERTWPTPPTPTLRWGIVDEQYEGIQAPLYYVLLVPAYWAGRAVGGLVGSFYALRLASLLMAVGAIPLVALLARALVPRRRAVWLLAPAVIAALQIVNVQNSYVDNDALTIVAGAACVLALLAHATISASVVASCLELR